MANLPATTTEKSLSATLLGNSPTALAQVIARLNTEALEKNKEALSAAIKEYKHLSRVADKTLKSGGEISTELRDNILSLEERIDALPYFPTLRSLRNRNKEEAAKQIMLMLIWLSDQVNVSNNLTSDQIKSLAHDLLENPEYSSLRLEDLAIICRDALKGKYGPFMGRLDGQMVRTWVETYANTLKEERMRGNYNSYLAQKESRAERGADRYQDGDHAAALLNFVETIKRQQ